MAGLFWHISNGNHSLLKGYLRAKSRWHRQGKLGSAELFSKFDLIILLAASSLGSGIYNHVLACSIHRRRVNTDLIPPARDTAFFESDSVDYCPKSRCWSGWNVLRNGQGWRVISPIIVWTLRSMYHNPRVFESANPLPGRNQRVSVRGLLPGRVILQYRHAIQPFKWKSMGWINS